MCANNVFRSPSNRAPGPVDKIEKNCFFEKKAAKNFFDLICQRQDRHGARGAKFLLFDHKNKRRRCSAWPYAFIIGGTDEPVIDPASYIRI
jgi:hypothetical protein